VLPNQVAAPDSRIGRSLAGRTMPCSRNQAIASATLRGPVVQHSRAQVRALAELKKHIFLRSNCAGGAGEQQLNAGDRAEALAASATGQSTVFGQPHRGGGGRPDRRPVPSSAAREKSSPPRMFISPIRPCSNASM